MGLRTGPKVGNAEGSPFRSILKTSIPSGGFFGRACLTYHANVAVAMNYDNNNNNNNNHDDNQHSSAALLHLDQRHDELPPTSRPSHRLEKRYNSTSAYSAKLASK